MNYSKMMASLEVKWEKNCWKKNVYIVQDWVGLFDEQGENLFLSS